MCVHRRSRQSCILTITPNLQIKDYAAIAKSSVEIAAAAAVAVAPAAVLQLAGGAAVMGNLAAAGALVGGGVAMGVGVAAAAPALAVNIAIQKVLDDNPDLPQGERDARAVARAGGAVAGAAGVLGAGTMLMGLSGAGMAVEMAAIGGVVGGGMATGAAILVAAPAIAAVAATAGLYGLGKANEAHTEAAEYAKANLQTLTASGVLAAISLDQQLLAQLLEMLGEGLPYIEMPTLGGHVFWSDMAEANGWKLQRNDVFGNCRIIDVTERGKAWGQTGKMIRAINQLATELAKGQNKKKGVRFAYHAVHAKNSACQMAHVGSCNMCASGRACVVTRTAVITEANCVRATNHCLKKYCHPILGVFSAAIRYAQLLVALSISVSQRRNLTLLHCMNVVHVHFLHLWHAYQQRHCPVMHIHSLVCMTHRHFTVARVVKLLAAGSQGRPQTGCNVMGSTQAALQLAKTQVAIGPRA